MADHSWSSDTRCGPVCVTKSRWWIMKFQVSPNFGPLQLTKPRASEPSFFGPRKTVPSFFQILAAPPPKGLGILVMKFFVGKKGSMLVLQMVFSNKYLCFIVWWLWWSCLLGWDVIFASISNTLGLKMVEPYKGTGQKLKAFPFCLPYALAGIVSWVMHLLILKKNPHHSFSEFEMILLVILGCPKILRGRKSISFWLLIASCVLRSGDLGMRPEHRRTGQTFGASKRLGATEMTTWSWALVENNERRKDEEKKYRIT